MQQSRGRTFASVGNWVASGRGEPPLVGWAAPGLPSWRLASTRASSSRAAQVDGPHDLDRDLKRSSDNTQRPLHFLTQEQGERRSRSGPG